MRAGDRLGRYTLVEQLSEGFPGPRWAAREGASSRELHVIRRLETDRLGDPEAVHRLASAAFWAMDMRHPGVLPVSDVVATGGELALVSPYVEGETLRAALRRAHRERQPFSADLAVHVACKLCDALAAVEQAAESDADPESLRYAAGGLSPDGVLLTLDGRALLLDVGVSAVASAEPAWTRDPVRAGYHAPERFGGMTLDARSDVFVLGVLLWEMLALEHLFPGLRSEQVAEALWAQEIPPLQGAVRGSPLPRGLADVVHRALERESEDRFDGYTEFAGALRALPCDGRPGELGEFVKRIGGRLGDERRARLGHVG